MTNALAAPPTRATSSVTLAWGLVNIPVSVYAATEDTGVSRKEFRAKTDNPVGRVAIDKVTGDVLERDDVERRAQASDGTWVVLYDDEVAEVTAPTVKCEVVSFVPLASIGGTYLVEKHYIVRPKREKGKSDPNIEQGFALLMQTMARRQVAALIKVAMRGPARYAAVLPDGRMVTLHYAEGVRETPPFAQVTLPAGAEAMADQLIDLVGVGEPTLHDTNGPALQAFVDAKAAGNNPTPTPAAEAPNAEDLLSNLFASIEASKAASKAQPKATAKRKPKAA